ncbi:MAG TPA: putative ABC exporter domain-containing protein [Candidatus Elarobacter sp.]|nr:putative ABC exporter domain-containing protein [Candidatus Elarobacter sp.]
MNAFVTLSYGDRRGFVNALRALRRKPGRAIMWAVYAVAIVSFAVLKTGPWYPRHSSSAIPPFTLQLLDLWVCGLAIAFGVVLATGTARWLGVFSSRAEALVLMRADAPPVTVAAYLQLRTVIVTMAQGITRFAYLIVFGLPGGATFAALVAQLIFFAAAGAAIASVALPRTLARGATRAALIVAGWAIAVAAAAPLIADALRIARLSGTDALLRRIPAWHPGALLAALAAGDLRAVAIPIVIVACATAAFAFAARDAYPELYAISLAHLDWRERVRMRRGRRGADAPAPRVKNAVSTTRTRLRGALAFVWIDALMFGRRVSPTVATLVVAVALAAGVALAELARSDNGDKVFGIMLGGVPAVYITIASTIGVRLAPALRLPLFWLGDVPLAARLAAWTFGGFWRDALIVALAVAGYVAVAHDARIPLAVFVAALGLLALTRTVGLAVFAMLPNAIDQRGPGVVLRVWLCFALLVPAIAAGTIAAFVSGFAFGAATTTATVTAFAESALLLAFAAWRLAGRVDNLALS